MKLGKTLIACSAISLVTVGLLVLIFSTEPTAERVNATKRTPMLVEVISAEAGDFKPRIRALGTVIPEKEVWLSAQVSGEIIEIAPALAPGSSVKKGQILAQIEPSDYEAAVMEQESALRQALAELELERGRQKVAQQDFELLEEALTPEDPSLILREPQLNMAMARVESARASLKQAQLDLDRTKIRAPFDAHILERMVNEGSRVSAGANVAHLVATENYWVEATIPVDRVSWINFQSNQGSGSFTTVRNRTAWKNGVFREGSVHQLIGSLDNETRMARVLINVNDPLSLKPENTDKPQLILGGYVEAVIDGEVLESVVRLDRRYLRRGETVWVKEDGKLDIREVSVAFQDENFVYIDEGIEPGESVVTTNLARIIQGAELRLEGESE